MIEAAHGVTGVATAPKPAPQVDGPRPDARAGRRWTIAVTVAIAVHGAAFFAWRVPAARILAPVLPAPRVVWSGASAVMQASPLGDQLNLFDSAPLFLPTAWNYAMADRGEKSSRAPGEIFSPYKERLTPDADQSPPELSPLPSGVDSAAAAMRRFEWPYFEAFGQVDRSLAKLDERLALIEVRSATTGATVWTVAVPASAAFGARAWGFWAPIEFLASVEPSGVLGLPQIARSSDFEEVDSFFRSYVQRDLKLNLRLPPGYYRLIVGP